MARKLFIALVVLAGLSGCATYGGYDRTGYYGDDPYYDGGYDDGASSYYYGGRTDYYPGAGYGLLGRGYGGWYGGLGLGYGYGHGLGYGNPYRYGYGGSAYRFWPYGGHRWPYYYSPYPRVPRPPHRPDTPERPTTPLIERGTGGSRCGVCAVDSVDQVLLDGYVRLRHGQKLKRSCVRRERCGGPSRVSTPGGLRPARRRAPACALPRRAPGASAGLPGRSVRRSS